MGDTTKTAIINELDGLNEDESTYFLKLLIRLNQGTVKSISYVEVSSESEQVLNIRKINIV